MVSSHLVILLDISLIPTFSGKFKCIVWLSQALFGNEFTCRTHFKHSFVKINFITNIEYEMHIFCYFSVKLNAVFFSFQN